MDSTRLHQTKSIDEKHMNITLDWDKVAPVPVFWQTQLPSSLPPFSLVMSRGFQGFIANVQVFYGTKINYSYKTHTSNMLLMPNFWRGLVGMLIIDFYSWPGKLVPVVGV